jgi:hypothetical protein
MPAGGGSNQDLNKLINMGVGAAASHFIPGFDYVSGANNLISGNYGAAAKDLVSGLTGGISGLLGFANGGAVAFDGGGSVFSPEFKQYAVDHIDPRMLPVAENNAQARGDLDTYKAAIQQMSDDAALRRGIAPALPQGFDVVRAAGGGILGFAGGAKIPSEQELMQMALQDRPTQTPEQYETNITKGAETLSKLYGEDPTIKYAKEMEDLRKQYQGGLSNFDKATIFAQMAGAVVDPAAGGNTMRGLGLMSKVGGQAAAQAMAQNKQADRDLFKSQVELSSAQQNRKEGRINAAAAHEDKAQALESNAFESKRKAAETLAQIQSHEAISEKQIAAMAAHQGPAVLQIADRLKKEGDPATGEELLRKAATIASAGSIYGADTRSNAAYIKALEAIEDKYKLIAMLPEGSPERKRMELERDRRIADLRAAQSQGAPSAGISSALPKSGSPLQQSDLDLIKKYSGS